MHLHADQNVKLLDEVVGLVDEPVNLVFLCHFTLLVARDQHLHDVEKCLDLRFVVPVLLDHAHKVCLSDRIEVFDNLL
jgi:hypothetical protein